MFERAAHLVIGSAAAAFDRAAAFAANAQARGKGRSAREDQLRHEERLRWFRELAARYTPEIRQSYFREPRPISPAERLVKRTRRGKVVDLSWQSSYAPFLDEVAARYDRHLENHVAAVRLFVDEVPRPLLILVHGYMAGQFSLEQRVWPVEWFRRIGFDVGLFTLPFHGVRSAVAQRMPPFPGNDPRLSNEGFRQAMGDLRDFMQWLRERGHEQIGISGMSLGGYTTALAATLESKLAFAIPIIPLASLADFARDQGRLGTTPEERAREHLALDALHEVISPLHRKPLIAGERMLIVAAKADRITPISHAIRLSRHFGARLETMPGGHLLQIGRSESFRRVGRFLGELGLLRQRA